MFSPFSQLDHRYKDASSPCINTEPMTIGSPVTSPKNKPASNQNYLPSYLFGETAVSPISPSWHAPKQSNISIFHSPSTSTVNQVSQFKQQQVSFQSPSSTSIISTPNPAKSGGPPIQGLLIQTPSVSDNLAPDAPNFSVFTPNKSLCATNTSFLSPAQLDPFYTQGEALSKW
ncbi:nucleoporin NUP53 [Caerostris extrusa]|uniref:Nucleoporin NUP53 n=1 Tax=Caerostris extrusa TaxID=172846 RepID=A0AAV4V0N1_CAEEX|nr:nucleoporin NUP53 [Caerostris extrusa]